MNYILINFTKRETIDFSHLPVGKKKEIAGSVASSSIVTWYMLNNRNDNIRFYSDQEYFELTKTDSELSKLPDRTSDMLDVLIQEGILKNHGFRYIDSDNKDIYLLDIENVWNK